MDIDLSVRIGNLVMPNPVGVASGTFGYGEEYRDLIDIDRLGALYA
ncbi:dihydroorotate dehydrogenase, partial [bacterium]|nr:dihydroorotate dehydrogenase [bacterium]